MLTLPIVGKTSAHIERHILIHRSLTTRIAIARNSVSVIRPQESQSSPFPPRPPLAPGAASLPRRPTTRAELKNLLHHLRAAFHPRTKPAPHCSAKDYCSDPSAHSPSCAQIAPPKLHRPCTPVSTPPPIRRNAQIECDSDRRQHFRPLCQCACFGPAPVNDDTNFRRCRFARDKLSAHPTATARNSRSVAPRRELQSPTRK